MIVFAFIEGKDFLLRRYISVHAVHGNRTQDLDIERNMLCLFNRNASGYVITVKSIKVFPFIFLLLLLFRAHGLWLGVRFLLVSC